MSPRGRPRSGLMLSWRASCKILLFLHIRLFPSICFLCNLLGVSASFTLTYPTVYHKLQTEQISHTFHDHFSSLLHHFLTTS